MKKLFVIILACFSHAAWGQNLLANGAFDTDLSGWSLGSNAISWSAVDEFGGNSGSAYLPDTGDVGTLMQICVDVDSNSVMALSASYMVPESVTTAFNFPSAVELLGYANTGCSGSLVYRELDSQSFNGLHEWRRLSVKGQAGAASVRVWLYVVGSGSSDFAALFDNVFLGDMLFEDGFENLP